ncbi:MAG TPA: HAD family phosphatase [Gemmatales bacterium]|nr:HAD family phosphatase [Gemmatales bacterium]
MHTQPLHERGVIWDLDGTLIDSTAQHFASWAQVARERGYPFTQQDFSRTFGRRNPEILGLLFDLPADHPELETLGDHKEELFRAAVQRDGVQLLPGALELVQALAEHGFKQAIGSSAPRANIELLTKVANLSPHIQTVVAMEDCQKGKPDPEVFLKAAGKLGILPGWCVVVEDAVFGVEAAKAGHFSCIAVRGGGHSTAADLRSAQADIVVEWLTELSVQHFSRLVK